MDIFLRYCEMRNQNVLLSWTQLYKLQKPWAMVIEILQFSVDEFAIFLNLQIHCSLYEKIKKLISLVTQRVTDTIF